MNIAKVIGFVIGKIIYLLIMIWLFISLIPLLIGGLMIDILLRILGVEKTFLMLTDIARWMETLGVYLKTRKLKNEISGDKEEYV